MPRANRYILPGNIYHLTHRCHDRKFLLRFARDRDGYRRRLREAVADFDLSLLGYNITSNHVHLIVFADELDQVAGLMQRTAAEFARDYNRRKERSGAFWQGRYFATMIDSGNYLWQCLKYVELNMVRCGVVQHPRDWLWSGYHELLGLRRRNRLLDITKLLWLLQTSDLDEFRVNFNVALDEAILRDECHRESKWTEALAVGSRSFVAVIEQNVRNRRELELLEESTTWVLRERDEPVFEPENRPIGYHFDPNVL